MILSPHQDAVMQQVSAWYQSKEQCFALGGYAGTGKSTLATKLQEHVSGKTWFCAYTGKAAHVLRQKGLEASTLHSALYTPKEKGHSRLKDLQLLLEKAEDADKKKELVKLIDKEKRNVATPHFALNPDSPLLLVDLVVVDEFSMLSTDLIEDLKTVAKKILFLGDPGQLPPVRGECPIKPDAFLTEVHRQALDSPILRAATAARLGERIEGGHPDEGFWRCAREDVSWKDYQAMDQVICARNETRRIFNNKFRKYLGRLTDDPMTRLPVKHDKMICTKNSKEDLIFNGQIELAGCNAMMADEHAFDILFGTTNVPISVWAGHFMDSKAKPEIWHMRELNQLDYGYAITCHKAQGSEFDSVLVYNEGAPGGRELQSRWLYTAITRAKDRLILVEPTW